MLKKEDKEQLQEFEKFLKTAKERDYIYGLSAKQTKTLFEIADRLHMKSGSPNCPKCVLNTLKNLANEYFKLEDPKPENNINILNEEQEVPEPTKPASKPAKTSKKPTEKPRKTNKKK